MTGIGSRLSPEKILEAILLPDHAITEGFEQAVVATKDERVLSGRVEGENEAELTLLGGDGARIRIARADILTRSRAKSAMPEDAAKVLTKRELRDFIAYLSSLKETK